MILELRGIKKSFRNGMKYQSILEDLDIKIYEGDSIAIKGKSGCGKSTLLHILAGLITSDAGEILFKGMNLSQLSEEDQANYRRKNVGYITQNFHLLDDRNVYDNIALPLQYLEFNKIQIKEKVEKVSHDLEIEHIIKRDITTLSGGERQRVAIARAIIKEPAILLADEPTGSLDDKTEESIMEIFKNLNEKGMTLAIVTHDNSVSSYCKQVYELKNKKLYSVIY
ncbi:ABC transporter ATP-binding protein [Alkaliphilus sp. MSJ-5]|uniref:ABC transporter ATP-binding protein n=1 Tax=Alkaliphilus flagellatus TaxID=2841507 RepID=A0ABS6G136_9FIRM|nr:ABC transporter ATP-binding protein [Alkaliphilus flagellatus]MBU5676206.1 ABC transporter ATP-binding protein [Alkaliphilus flagellatus]